MSNTVNQTFIEFRSKTVDLIPQHVLAARASRDYLWDQIQIVASKNSDFPKITGKYFHYGSFARRTKVQPLDDIDMMFVLDGTNGQYFPHPTKSYVYRVKPGVSDAPLMPFVGDDGYVSSIKVLNRVRDKLALVENYKRAGIKRTMQAVVLDLKSYPWAFDIVPALGAHPHNSSVDTAFYLIPDGYGDWIATDPRQDAGMVTSANKNADGMLLPLLRVLKFWNTFGNQPKLGSYYFENLVLKVFESVSGISNIQSGIKYFFDNAPTPLFAAFPDPKNLGPALDSSITWETAKKVEFAMVGASQNSAHAIAAESRNDHKTAISYWQRVFVTNFPDYY